MTKPLQCSLVYVALPLLPFALTLFDLFQQLQLVRVCFIELRKHLDSYCALFWRTVAVIGPFMLCWGVRNVVVVL